MMSRSKHIKVAVTNVGFVVMLLCLTVGCALFLGNPPDLSVIVDGAERFSFSTNSLQRVIEGFGAWSVLAFLVIQASQVVAGPVPAGPVIVAGSALFGFWEGFTLSMIGVVAGSVCAFLLGRRFGLPLLRRLVGEEALAKHSKTQEDSDGWWLLISHC